MLSRPAPDARLQVNRLVALEGGRNFRDLGGYATRDGRHVRWGHLYRSGVMSYLTDADRLRLDGLGLRTLCDFRSPGERKREPTNWPAPGVQVLHWDYDFRNVSLRAVLADVTELTAETTHRCMTELYRRLPTLFARPYADLFSKLAQRESPLVFHCAAGKDRTGLAAALILISLGVPRDSVLDDYMLTDSVVDLEASLFEHPRTSIGVGDEHAHLRRVDREARAPLLQARPEYLQAAIDRIEGDHRSVEAYLREGLGVTDEMLRDIRDHLLEG